MATSLTHKYIPRTQQIQENLFIEEYYSSTDVKIYIEGVEQTEISYISYSLQEQLKPLYGYASNTFDDVAIGNRIVTGVIRVPINNTENNDTKEEIIERSKNSNYGYINPVVFDYNLEQEIIAEENDWIGSDNDIIPDDSEDDKDTSTTPETDNESNPVTGGGGGTHFGEPETGGQTYPDYEEDGRLEYIAKLIKLGYEAGSVVSTHNTIGELSKVIKDFQKNEGDLEVTGELDDLTKQRIDENTGEIKFGTIVKNTYVFSEPNRGGSNAYVKLQTDKNWKIAILDQGVQYYEHTYYKVLLLDYYIVGYVKGADIL